MRRWKILVWNDRPKVTHDIEYACLGCFNESLMPINIEDLPIAQVDKGIVFDSFPTSNAMPDAMECPHCRKQIERAIKEKVEEGDVR